MYLPKGAPRNRVKEAQRARDNRAEVQKALNLEQVSRRDLFKMGIFTATGALALKHGLSPFASSAFGAVPTGTPRSPLFGARPFTQPMPRPTTLTPHALTEVNVGGAKEVMWPAGIGEPLNSKRLSWHTEFSAARNAGLGIPDLLVNPHRPSGPAEGRPPGEWFGHQGWKDYLPRVGYRLSLGRLKKGQSFHPNFPDQSPDTVWTFAAGGLGTRGSLPLPLIKVRYGEPAIVRIYNSLSFDRAANNGFGKNETSVHNHNAHNAAASDGANNAYFFPGQFYDYHWSTCLARADTVNLDGQDLRASGIDDNGKPYPVRGDFRELQGTLWFHDHRFFYTAENVYKGNLGRLNYYSGPDRGNEALDDKINLRLPSGSLLAWGNTDFDVNLTISDFALDQSGQLFFDIFDTDGFVGDNLLVNFAYAPYFNVMRRKYRFRMLNACMARFLKLVLVNSKGDTVPMTVIAVDGNLIVNPVTVDSLDPQGSAERFDVIVDFSKFRVGDKLQLVNHIAHANGRGPKETVSVRDALRGKSDDPAVGAFLEFRVVSSVQSVDVPGYYYYDGMANLDRSRVPPVLTEAIPVERPVRTREIEFKRGSTINPNCFPECGEKEAFPWQIRINGESTHYLNANRSSLIIPRPGEIEHWTLKNGGGDWDHPVHLHFEEGVTISRTVGQRNSPLQVGVRKDVWRLGEGGEVKIQVKFSEFGGSYVTHCHNTVHEDFAMLLRFDILKEDNGTGDPFVALAPTANPTPDGVEYLTPEILPEGDPRRRARREA